MLNLFLNLPILPRIMIHVNLHSEAYTLNCSQSEIALSINGMGKSSIWYKANWQRKIERKLNQQNYFSYTHGMQKKRKKCCGPVHRKVCFPTHTHMCGSIFFPGTLLNLLMPMRLNDMPLLIRWYWWTTLKQLHPSAAPFSLSASLERYYTAEHIKETHCP